jgi:hypothetical protein
MSEIGSLDSEGQPAWLLIACFIVVLACNLTGWIATQSKVRTDCEITWCLNSREWLPGSDLCLCHLQKWASQTATQRLLDEISSLRKSAAQHNQPSTYAVSAKYQRQANAKEKELKALQEVVPTSSRVESLTNIVKVSSIWCHRCHKTDAACGLACCGMQQQHMVQCCSCATCCCLPLSDTAIQHDVWVHAQACVHGIMRSLGSGHAHCFTLCHKWSKWPAGF